jgi:hypothetical protein
MAFLAWLEQPVGVVLDVSGPSDRMFCNAVDVEVLNETTKGTVSGSDPRARGCRRARHWPTTTSTTTNLLLPLWSPWLLRSLPHAVDQARQCQKSWHLQPGVPRSAGPQGGASRRSAANNSEKTLLYRRMAHDSISIKPQPSSLAAFAVSWTIPSSS